MTSPYHFECHAWLILVYGPSGWRLVFCIMCHQMLTPNGTAWTRSWCCISNLLLVSYALWNPPTSHHVGIHSVLCTRICVHWGVQHQRSLACSERLGYCPWQATMGHSTNGVHWNTFLPTPFIHSDRGWTMGVLYSWTILRWCWICLPIEHLWVKPVGGHCGICALNPSVGQ